MRSIRAVLSSTFVLSGLLITVLLTPAHADTLQGLIDNEAYSWHVLQQGDTSTATFAELSPGMLSVTLQGHAEQRYATQGTLSINFTLMDGEVLADPEVAFFHSERMRPHYASDGAPESWQLNVQEVDGDSGRFAGRYQGVLQLMGTADETQPESIAVDIEFDVQAQRTEY